MSKNLAIELLRFVAISVICLHHLQGEIPDMERIINHGYLLVELFFILSGFFIYASLSRKEYGICDFVSRRVARLYPQYIVALVLLYLFLLFKDDATLNVVRCVWEITMIQNSGIVISGGYNYPCWYVSVLVLCLVPSYLLATKVPKQVFLYCVPFFCFFSYTFMFSQGLENWGVVGCVYYPLLRGFTDICLGGLIFLMLPKFECKSKKINTLVILLATAFSMFAVCSQVKYEAVAVIAFIFLVFTLFKNNYISTFLNRFKVIGLLGGLSYSMYLNHLLTIFVFKYLLEMNSISLTKESLILWFVSLLFLSYVMEKLSEIGVKLKNNS